MATGSKAASKKQSPAKASQKRDDALADARRRQPTPDPLSPENLRKMGLRVGLPVAILWVIAFFIPGMWAKIAMAVITVALAGVVLWAVRFANKSKAVVEILKGADTKEARKQALERLDSEFKKDDAAAVFAKAQLQMQEDPRTALATLEAIKLDKVMAHVADEARAQRAMIHLILGETDEARALVDPIDLSRHSDARGRATLTAIVAEAWARTGQAKRAVELLEKIDLDDATFEDIKPQLLRSRAFAYAWANDTKQMRGALAKLRALNPQLLMGFITKKKNPMGVSPRGVHPALEKEAFDMVMKSGLVQRKMEMRRG